MPDFITLGIESSCDETGVAIYSKNNGLLSDKLFSQIKLHAEYGGVVPEIASRDHLKRSQPLIQQALKDAKLSAKQLNGITYTRGPGLSGALLVGATIAKSLAFALNIPALGVHHMEGHLLAPMLDGLQFKPPFIALLVSGGHTMLVAVKKFGKYNILGESLDDAVGEAFDKTAKIMGLGYPGGIEIEKLAKLGKNSFKFPRPMINHQNLDFSFSGLKTFARNTFAENPTKKNDIAFAFQESAVDILSIKSRRALEQTNYKTLVVAGGVSSNLALRTKLDKMANKLAIKIIYPPLKFCTDNGAMIALSGNIRMSAGEKDDNLQININPRWNLEDL